MNPDYLVWILVAVDVVVALGYSLQEDFARVAYWVGAALVTGATLFMGR